MALLPHQKEMLSQLDNCAHIGCDKLKSRMSELLAVHESHKPFMATHEYQGRINRKEASAQKKMNLVVQKVQDIDHLNNLRDGAFVK